jgi:hypothetical protein
MKILKVAILALLLTGWCFASAPRCESYVICPIDGQAMYPGGQKTGPGGQHLMGYTHYVYINDPDTGKGKSVTHWQWVACD